MIFLVPLCNNPPIYRLKYFIMKKCLKMDFSISQYGSTIFIFILGVLKFPVGFFLILENAKINIVVYMEFYFSNYGL